MENFAFTISLADALTGPSKRMQSALALQKKGLMDLAAPAMRLEKSIASLGVAMQKSEALGDFKAWDKQNKQLLAYKLALDKTDKSQLNMIRDIDKQSKALGESIKKTSQLAGVYGAIGAGALAVGKSIVGATVGIIEFTLEQAQAKAAMQNTFAAMAGGKKAGDQLFEMMETLATQVPQSKDKLGEWSKQFMAMGVLDQSKLRTQLLATASAEALMGDKGVEAFTGLSKKIQEAMLSTGKLKLGEKQLAGFAATGVNVADVASKMGMSVIALSAGLKAGTINASKFNEAMTGALITKGAGPLEKMGKSLESLSVKFKEALGDIFEDVDIGPFVDALKDMLGLFTQGTESGKEMKTVLGSMFTGLFSEMGKVTQLTELMFLKMIGGALSAYIAIKPFTGALKAVGVVVLGSLLGWGLYTLAVGAVGAAAWISSGGLTAMAAAGWAALAPILVAAAPFVAFGIAVLGVYEAFTHWDQIKEMALAAFSWVDDLTGNLISGLVSGIVNGLPHVLKAISDLGHAALNKLSSVFDSHSPSRAFKMRGLQGGQGLAGGFDASVPMVKQSVSKLGNAALSAPSINAPSLGSDSGAAPIPAISAANFSVPQQAPAAAASGSTGGKQVTVHVGGIHIDGAGKSADQITEQAVTLVFERIALETA